MRRKTKPTQELVGVMLTHAQVKELKSLLWECCTETVDGVKTLREELPLTTIWRRVVEADALLTRRARRGKRDPAKILNDFMFGRNTGDER